MRFFLFLSLSLWANLGTALEQKVASAGQEKMNGYSLKSFPNFEKNWKFVTARYRTDTKEIRMVYANKLAWKTLSSGAIAYPDGAVFAKVAFVTSEDPDFTSSEVPAGTRRYQFMVHDSKKFKETDNWGYMLFDSDGKTFPEDQTVQSMACAACHKIVEKNRGGVFSTIMHISPHEKHLVNLSKLTKSLTFTTVPIESLSEKVVKFLPPDIKAVRSLLGSLQENLFQGTLDEVKPILIKEALSSKLPTMLYNQAENRFSLVYFNLDNSSCNSNSNQKKYALISVTSQLKPKEPLIHHFCSQ